MEKVGIDLDRFKGFLDQYENPLFSSDTEILCLAAIGFYSKKYEEALQIVQDRIIEKNLPINRAWPVNNYHIDKELAVAITFLYLFLGKENFIKFNLHHLLHSPRQSEIRKDIHKNLKVNSEKMTERFGKHKRIKVEDFDVGDNVAVKVTLIDRGKCGVGHALVLFVIKSG